MINKLKSGLLVFVIALLGGLSSLALNNYFKNKSNSTFSEVQTAYQTSNFGTNAIPNINFVGVSEKAVQTVVHIKTTYNSENNNNTIPDQHFFDPFEFFNNKRVPQGLRQSSGSGVILTPDGYIVTNNHVIQKASKIEVVLNDKRTYIAEVVGADPETDLALLKVEVANLEFLPFGNSDELRIGEWVIAVGNPMNLTSTVTAGIVSAKGRNINLLRQNTEYAIENFIQTDAAVNPGNSGGALVNIKGELVGINTAIASETGTNIGYSFAIPVNIAKKVLGDLKKYGEVKRAILGIRIQDITAELAEQNGLKEIKGVYVPEVMAGSAADKAKLKKGDVLLKINNVDVNSSSQLQEQVSLYYPGQKVDLTIKRNNTLKIVRVTLMSKDGKTQVKSEIKKK